MNVEVDIVGGADENETAAILAAIQALIAEEEEAIRAATAPSRWKAAPRRFPRDPWKIASSESNVGDPGSEH
ncbi:MAG: hypothetical protein V3U39_05165 [Acidimicrobiia bacterium]|jgi:hypothetical protein